MQMAQQWTPLMLFISTALAALKREARPWLADLTLTSPSWLLPDVGFVHAQ